MLKNYDVVWNSQSMDSFDSMPLSGSKGAGANVWVQDHEIWLYLAHNGAYDEFARLLKLGCLKIHVKNLEFSKGLYFQQKLDLERGRICIDMKADHDENISFELRFCEEDLCIVSEASTEVALRVSFGTWRDRKKRFVMDKNEDRTLVNADAVAFADNMLSVLHINQHCHEKELISDRVFGLALAAKNSLRFEGENDIQWQTWGGTAYTVSTTLSKKQTIVASLGVSANGKTTQFVERASDLLSSGKLEEANKKADTRWKEFWSRSFIHVADEENEEGPAFQISKNYHLFRYMLACNQGGEFPLKFNGGIFTTDLRYSRLKPELESPEQKFMDNKGTSPDFRRWGQLFMGQNQRWLGWPALQSGDYDLFEVSSSFYRNRHPAAQKRAKGLMAEGACYVEPLDLFGNCHIKADKNDLCDYVHLKYHFILGIEFAWMTLLGHSTFGTDMAGDLPWMMDVVKFYSSYYRNRNREKTGKELTDGGKLVIYPCNSHELGAYATNPIDVVAGLRALADGLLKCGQLDDSQTNGLSDIYATLPELPAGFAEGKEIFTIADQCEKYCNSWEIPEMDVAWPYRLAGVSKPQTLEKIRNTWNSIPIRGDTQDVLVSKLDYSWQTIWLNMDVLGWADEAKDRGIKKLSDRASAARFPAFFGPGHDWLPDHNWGGNAMVGLQEMIVQCDGEKIILGAAFPEDWTCEFKLHALYHTVIEGQIQNGEFYNLKVTPVERMKDVIYANCHEHGLRLASEFPANPDEFCQNGGVYGSERSS